MTPYSLLDLFSGIGGFSLGLEASGAFETAAFCEISPKCRHLLKHHWPEVPSYDDVCTLSAERLAADGIRIDAICGGFPCQDLSLAGRGAGLAGERSGLWREYARLIREFRPSCVIVENVSALLGRGLGDVLGDLAALGYHAWWDCIPASAVGAPHRRDRLWLVAYPGSVEHQGYGDALRRALAAQFSGAYPDADREPHEQHPGSLSEAEEARAGRCNHGPWGVGQDVADPARLQPRWAEQRTERKRAWARSEQCGRPGWWQSEPDVGRVANGVPARVDRLHGLGNAVVPEIPRRIGLAIAEARRSTLERAAA